MSSHESNDGNVKRHDHYFDIAPYAESTIAYRNTQSPYYPVYIGQTLNNNYRIEHKLGHGGFSTVWMAHDMRGGKNVALKILVAGQMGEDELTIQNEIKQKVSDTNNLVLYEATFRLPGYNTLDHRVFVFPIHGPSLRSSMRSLPIAHRMHAVRPLAQALQCLHSGGFVCRGNIRPLFNTRYVLVPLLTDEIDLNSKNAMWGVVSLDKYDTSAIYQRLGRPKKQEIFGDVKGWRAELVRPVEVPRSLIRKEVYLGDFGMAIRAGTSVDFKGQTPVVYCAPERYHNIDPSFASDMWSYMVIFAELYLGTTPFHGIGVVQVISYIVSIVGPLPQEWKGSYEGPGTAPDSWYDRSSKPYYPLKEQIGVIRPEVSDSERDIAVSIFSRGLCYLPEARISMEELLQDDSFKALLDLYGL
ncbi:kinase domain-containing protein [Amylocarpus encephaloides]|uniref:Kinase domain-containing protein n=1 Tax=Amylocarpus encephaloides TaxID=45428 RepID=A0A9P7YQC3_9HELO|nr:kinase domain-containing protein [Amylocarpus encephaloides]